MKKNLIFESKAIGQPENVKVKLIPFYKVTHERYTIYWSVMSEKEYKNIDFMIAVGSGTIHDITRYHAYEKKIPFLSVPTAASVDGFVSTVAAMTWHGFKKSFTAVAPCFVLADSEIFSKAPLRLTASGVGDLLGKYTALCDWKIAHIITGEYICDKVVDMEYEVLKDLCANLDGIGSQNIEAYENLMYGLLLSGIAMQMIGNSKTSKWCRTPYVTLMGNGSNFRTN